MLTFLERYGKNIVYSQNGEEGIIAECLRRMEITDGHAVEIGANNGQWCSNTALLIDQGWSAMMVEGDYELYRQCAWRFKDNPNVISQCCRVNEFNVNAFVDSRCVVFSSDTDGPDYKIFSGLSARPPIVIVEIDSGMPHNLGGFNRDGAAGYLEMMELAETKGYFLLCHTGNLVLVLNKYIDLFPELQQPPQSDGVIRHWHWFTNSELFFNTAWLQK